MPSKKSKSSKSKKKTPSNLNSDHNRISTNGTLIRFLLLGGGDGAQHLGGLGGPEFPVAFVPVNLGIEMDDLVSKLNEAEAAAACDAVAALLAREHCTVSDIAVFTPYAAQACLIRRMTHGS